MARRIPGVGFVTVSERKSDTDAVLIAPECRPAASERRVADSPAMGLVLVETFPVAPLGCNCAIVADPGTRAAIVLDPGGEPDRVLAALARNGLSAVALVHTHAHLDHCLSSARLSTCRSTATWPAGERCSG